MRAFHHVQLLSRGAVEKVQNVCVCDNTDLIEAHNDTHSFIQCFIKIHRGLDPGKKKKASQGFCPTNQHRQCPQISLSVCLKFLCIAARKDSSSSFFILILWRKTKITPEVNSNPSKWRETLTLLSMLLHPCSLTCQLIQASLLRNLTASLKPSSHRDCMLLEDGGNRAWFRRFMFSMDSWGENPRKYYILTARPWSHRQSLLLKMDTPCLGLDHPNEKKLSLYILSSHLAVQSLPVCGISLHSNTTEVDGQWQCWRCVLYRDSEEQVSFNTVLELFVCSGVTVFVAAEQCACQNKLCVHANEQCDSPMSS